MKVLIAGDFCPRDRVSDLIELKDFSFFSEVIYFTNNSDFSILNLEAPVVFGNGKPISKCGPNLRCTSLAIEAIKYAGFDAVTLANNHIYDFGEKGILDTLDTLTNCKIEFVGGGKNIQDASRIFYKEIEGKRLAIINCCEHEFSIATETSGGANPLNPIQQYYAIREANKLADYVLVIVHGGHEYYQLPSLRMVESYRFFIDAGADAVVNHHQHCYSGYEIYKGKPIFYGIGNFCFDSKDKRNGIWNEGYLVQLSLENNAIDFSLFPYVQCDKEPRVRFLKTSEGFENELIRINSIISSQKMIKEKLSEFIEIKKRFSMKMFLPYSNRYLQYLSRYRLLPNFITKVRAIFLYNMINCESHRDIILENIRKIFKDE